MCWTIYLQPKTDDLLTIWGKYRWQKEEKSTSFADTKPRGFICLPTFLSTYEVLFRREPTYTVWKAYHSFRYAYCHSFYTQVNGTNTCISLIILWVIIAFKHSLSHWVWSGESSSSAFKGSYDKYSFFWSLSSFSSVENIWKVCHAFQCL